MPARAMRRATYGVIHCDMSFPPTLPVDPGLCATCVYSRIIQSDRKSTFWRCALADTNLGYRKYPRLPVTDCAGFEPAGDLADAAPDA